MNPEKFPETKHIKFYQELRNRLPEYPMFEFPATYYFKIYNDRLQIHWAVIVKEEYYSIYFIDIAGQAFDKLAYKTKKQAQRALRRNKFFFSTNKKCPYEPVKPVFIHLKEGKKSAPYSKGNLWDKQSEFNKKYIINKECSVQKKSPTKKEFDIIPYIVKLLVLVAIFLFHKLLK